MFRGKAGVAVLAALWAGAWGCSGAEDDSLGRACHIIVDECKKGTSVGDCIDALGGMHPDCLDCMTQQGCGYATCQRLPVGCRLALDLMGTGAK